jgi:medium-chain acyl-[acyl-carrier-protein] hydrolase
MLNSLKLSPWIKIFNPRSRICLRLFCFPYCGGGASFYKSWADFAPPGIEICAIQLPGRENRFFENLIDNMDVVSLSLVKGIIPLLDQPFVFFGHSMGALLSFELAHKLNILGFSTPLHLFVSGRQAPNIPVTPPYRHTMSDVELIKELSNFNGTPEAILSEPDLLNIFMPILRADFSIVETYTYRHTDALDCPITAFGGLHDTTVPIDQLSFWKEITRGPFRIKPFPGNHFYLKDFSSAILKEIFYDLNFR